MLWQSGGAVTLASGFCLFGILVVAYAYTSCLAQILRVLSHHIQLYCVP